MEGCRCWGAAPVQRLAPCPPPSCGQATAGMSPLLHDPTVLEVALILTPQAGEELRVLGVAPWRKSPPAASPPGLGDMHSILGLVRTTDTGLGAWQ